MRRLISHKFAPCTQGWMAWLPDFRHRQLIARPQLYELLWSQVPRERVLFSEKSFCSRKTAKSSWFEAPITSHTMAKSLWEPMEHILPWDSIYTRISRWEGWCPPRMTCLSRSAVSVLLAKQCHLTQRSLLNCRETLARTTPSWVSKPCALYVHWHLSSISCTCVVTPKSSSTITILEYLSGPLLPQYKTLHAGWWFTSWTKSVSSEATRSVTRNGISRSRGSCSRGLPTRSFRRQGRKSAYSGRIYRQNTQVGTWCPRWCSRRLFSILGTVGVPLFLEMVRVFSYALRSMEVRLMAINK